MCMCHDVSGTVGQSYLGCCQNDLLSVSSLSGHSLFSQESVRKVM